MAVGVLAYGSLIADPGPELEEVTIGRSTVDTPFRIEFARSSGGRSGAPTLVPVAAGGAHVRAVILEVSVDACEGSDIVYRRETGQIGTGAVYREPAAGSVNAVFIDRLPDFPGYDTVLSTRIAANIAPLSARRLAELAIDSARRRDDGRDGISYLIAALDCGIMTPLSADYAASILRLTGSPDLPTALAHVRRQSSEGISR